MFTVGVRRVALGTVAGGVVWGIWSTAISFLMLMPRYKLAQENQLMLAQPRYPLFVLYWLVTLFLLTYILTWVYVSARTTLGPGPVTALRVGLLMGFVISFPLSLTMAAWAPFSRYIVVGWMLDLWVGSMLATLVSASLYKDA
jgi:hypothetical protein